MRKFWLVLLAALMAAGLLLGCAPQSSQETASAQTTAIEAAATPVPKDLLNDDTDAMGASVAPVDTASKLRIVSTAPSATEILFALGCGDDIVGVDVSSTYPHRTGGRFQWV